MKNKLGFGTHLIVDGYECNRPKLEDINFIYTFLENYPGQMELIKIMSPYVFRYSADTPEDCGMSGFVLIDGGHIGVHTFPEKGYVSIDIFSPTSFDTELAEKTMKQIFRMKKSESRVWEREPAPEEPPPEAA